MQYRRGLEGSAVESKACKKSLELYGVRGIKMSPRLNIGFPDRQFLIPGGRPLFIEFKRPDGTGKLSEKQKLWRDRLVEAGYDYACCDSVDEALAAIDAAIKRARKRK